MPTAHQIRSTARAAGARDALGVPAAVLAAGMLGFGALALEAGFGPLLALACTAGIWALPGQIVLIEMHAAGAPGVVTVVAVMLTAVRFLPMSISLMPMMREPARPAAGLYAAAHFLAMTSWAWTMRRCIDMPREARLPYFVGFAATCWAVASAATLVGYLMAGAFPPVVRLGFVFLNPVYFVVLLIGDARNRTTVVALACGAVAGPLLYLASPQWSVPLGGLIGGTVAWLILRAGKAGHA